MNWSAWVKGIAHSVVGGAVNSVASLIADPKDFNLASGAGWRNVLMMAGTGAFISLVMFLKQSPIPPDAPPSMHLETGVEDPRTVPPK